MPTRSSACRDQFLARLVRLVGSLPATNDAGADHDHDNATLELTNSGASTFSGSNSGQGKHSATISRGRLASSTYCELGTLLVSLPSLFS